MDTTAIVSATVTGVIGLVGAGLVIAKSTMGRGEGETRYSEPASQQQQQAVAAGGQPTPPPTPPPAPEVVRPQPVAEPIATNTPYSTGLTVKYSERIDSSLKPTPQFVAQLTSDCANDPETFKQIDADVEMFASNEGINRLDDNDFAMSAETFDASLLQPYRYILAMSQKDMAYACKITYDFVKVVDDCIKSASVGGSLTLSFQFQWFPAVSGGEHGMNNVLLDKLYKIDTTGKEERAIVDEYIRAAQYPLTKYVLIFMRILMQSFVYLEFTANPKVRDSSHTDEWTSLKKSGAPAVILMFYMIRIWGKSNTIDGVISRRTYAAEITRKYKYVQAPGDIIGADISHTNLFQLKRILTILNKDPTSRYEGSAAGYYRKMIKEYIVCAYPQSADGFDLRTDEDRKEGDVTAFVTWAVDKLGSVTGPGIDISTYTMSKNWHMIHKQATNLFRTNANATTRLRLGNAGLMPREFVVPPQRV